MSKKSKLLTEVDELAHTRAVRYIPQVAQANTPLPQKIAHLLNQRLAENQPPRDRTVWLNSEICKKYSKMVRKEADLLLLLWELEHQPLLAACIPTLKMDTIILTIPIIKLYKEMNGI